jgi:Ca2+/Na+ antiporter
MGLTIASFLALAVDILLMPLTTRAEGMTLTYVLGGLFWLLLLLGVVFSLVAPATVRKEMERRGRGEQWKAVPIGLISFFQTGPGIVSDVLMIGFLVLIIVSRFTGLRFWTGMIVAYAALPLLIYLHCLFNGRTYCYIETIRKERLGRHEKH